MQPTTDPIAAIEGARLLPLGSTADGGAHKGYGLAVWVEVMCGVLSGTGFGAMLGPDNVGHFFGAVRVDLFQQIDTFKATMDDLVRELRATPPRNPDEPVLVAGDPEHAAEAERRALGVRSIRASSRCSSGTRSSSAWTSTCGRRRSAARRARCPGGTVRWSGTR